MSPDCTLRNPVDNECFVKVISVQFTIFVDNHACVPKREIICFIIIQPCPIRKPSRLKASIHWIFTGHCLSFTFRLAK